MERIEGARVDRRVERSDNITQALRYLLEACRAAGQLDAMALADRDGLLLAAAGDHVACEEVAARVAVMAVDVGSFRGTIIGETGTWPVHFRRLRVAGLALYACAIGGAPTARTGQLGRAADGIERILR